MADDTNDPNYWANFWAKQNGGDANTQNMNAQLAGQQALAGLSGGIQPANQGDANTQNMNAQIADQRAVSGEPIHYNAENGVTGTISAPTDAASLARYTQARDQNWTNTYGLSGSTSPLTWNPNSKAPTYDVSTQAGWDALSQQAKAADYGDVIKGLKQFDPSYTGIDPNARQLQGIASRMGFDLSGYNLNDPSGLKSAQSALEGQGNNYVTLKALTGGWGGTGDAREAATTLYYNDNGTLRAVNDPTVTRAPEKGGWLAEHGAATTAILGALIVGTAGAAGVGLAAGGAAGAGSGAGAAAAGTAGAGAATGAGAAAAGTAAGGAGLSGISGAIASALGPEAAAAWGGLSAVQQAAVLGALQGGAQGGLSGGGLQGILKGAALGGLSGGAGAWAGPAISSATGLSPTISKALGSAAVGGVTGGIRGQNPWASAASSGIGSLVGSGLSSAGMNSYLSGLGGSYAGGLAGGTVNSLLGGSGATGGGGGVGGGYSGGSGTKAASGGGMSASYKHTPTLGEVGNAQFMAATNEAIAREDAVKDLIKKVGNDPVLMAKIQREHPEWLTA